MRVALVILTLAIAAPVARAQTELVAFAPREGPPAMGYAVVDRDAGVVYAMENVAGTGGFRAEPTRRLIARRIRGGKVLWRSRAATAPVAIEGGYLIAFRYGTNNGLVLVDPRRGKLVSSCAGPQPAAPAAGVDFKTSVVVRRRGARLAVTSTTERWVASGVDWAPGNEPPPIPPVIAHVSVTVSGKTCSLRRLASLRGPAPVFKVVRRGKRLLLTGGKREVDLGGSAGARVIASADGAHAMVIRGKANKMWEARIWEAATGKRIAAVELRFVGPSFAVDGPRLLVNQGSKLEARSLRSGRLLWAQPLSGFSYSGPMPP